MNRQITRGLWAVPTIFLLIAQSAPWAAEPQAPRPADPLKSYAPGRDLFPDKVRVRRAVGFSMTYHQHYKVITVHRPWRGAKKQFQYVLVQRGAPVPTAHPDATMVRIPLRSIVTMATPFLPYLELLGVVDRLVGHSTFKWVNTPAIVERIEQGKLVEVGDRVSANLEVLLDRNPDVIMTHAYGRAQHDVYPKLQEAGLTVVLNGSYMETTPLGRAEWMKFIAAFFNREAIAEKRFREIEAEYERLARLTQDVANRPIVLTQQEYQGTWHTPGGGSYMARFIADAGAQYLWAEDTSTGSLRLDFEAVFDRGAGADFWLVNNPAWMRVQDVLSADVRYGLFSALSSGKTYNNNARVNAHGGNDYWEQGLANPHLLLADLIKIFHPQVLPQHKLMWYRRLKSE